MAEERELVEARETKHEHEAASSAAVVEGGVPAAQPNYYLIWLYLLIMTVAEVMVAFVSGLPDTWLILILLGLALWKAALVAMYYMHLKFEPPRLIIFILAAMPLAVLLALTVVTMEGW